MKRGLHQVLIGWNEKDAESVTYFTAYDIEVGIRDHVIRNEYKYLRGVAASAVPCNEVYFLGQCLVEDRYVSEEFYVEYLGKIKNYYAGEKLVYFPHPRQSTDLCDKIQRFLGIEIRKTNLPIECEVSMRGNMPKVIASFVCSALQNCRVILGDGIRINAFYIDPKYLLGSHELVRKSYEYFEANSGINFTVVKL
jgi:hypothetical protein